MTADIDAEGVSVGQSGKPFSGTFDGYKHTLTYNRGSATSESVEFVDDYCAPFSLLEGATIRHLTVEGTVCSRHKWAAGVASRIDGETATTIYDCHVGSTLRTHNDLNADATFGGIVGVVEGTCKASPTLEECSFTGTMDGNCSGGMVGYTSMPVTLKSCLVAPSYTIRIEGGATFIRTPEHMECPMEKCYYTQSIGVLQGEGVFDTIDLPEGSTYHVEPGTEVRFYGRTFWRSGSWVWLQAPFNQPFDHWVCPNNNCHISNPWGPNGLNQINDVVGQPSLSVETTMPAAKMERTVEGTKYRYLSRSDYFLYLSDELCREKGYTLDGDGWLVKMVDGTKVYVTGWWGPDIPSDGAQIHNDLVGDWRDHTLLGCIAPNAFKGCLELQTLYFKDTDANNYNAKTAFDFIIGDSAFANCPNLTEVKMMQYTTRGDNHWEALKANQVSSVGLNIFDGSPQANFSTDASEYQNYLSSQAWKPINKRVIVYNHTNVDMTVDGAKYTYVRNTAGDPPKNDADGNAKLMETLRFWNADYQQFTASSLLSSSSENVWYTTVVGCDDDYLKNHNGVMHIYNDPGSYYNYKTIAIGRNAFKGSKQLRAIEFWQTNGRSSNSYSDLKLVIQNGAFANCDSLKELRMYYYCEDGDNHWEVLGPRDVIPATTSSAQPLMDSR
jgi:hypothetical protein